MSLNIYLHFDGNCREVFEFYRSVFGGDFASLSTFSEAPEGTEIPEDEMDNVMHVAYPLGSGFLMGSDVPSAFAPPPIQGSNFSISYEPSSREEMDEVFAKLSDGGRVTMPVDEMFWGAYFGSCTDKFGINWQFNLQLSED